MRKEFESFLIESGYKKYTSSGKPSTVYDYIKRIDKVCEWEGLTWLDLANSIDTIINEYSVGGSKEQLGRKSHNAVICALRALRCYATR